MCYKNRFSEPVRRLPDGKQGFVNYPLRKKKNQACKVQFARGFIFSVEKEKVTCGKIRLPFTHK
jgi:hypothetical protein